jgi:hypothetical protein
MDVVETRLRCSEDLPLLPSRPEAGSSPAPFAASGGVATRRQGDDHARVEVQTPVAVHTVGLVLLLPPRVEAVLRRGGGRMGQLGKASGASKDGGGRSCSGAHAQIRSVASRVAAAGWALLRGRCGDGVVVGALRGWRGGWAPVGSLVSRSTGEMKETGGYLFLP